MVNHIVTIVGLSSYTSGAQLCKGAALTLNKNPIIIIISPNVKPCVKLVLLDTDIKLYIDYKFVKPV